MIGTLLVAHDLSPGATLAAERAALLARARGMTLELVCVVERSRVGSALAMLQAASPIDEHEIVRSLTGMLAQAAQSLATRHAIEVRHEVRTGHAYEVIAAHAAQRAATLVVVGAHGEDPVRDLFVGATALRVLQRAAAPILLVKRPAERDYRRILVATDLGPAAAAGARFARAWFADARFSAVHAYEIPWERELTLGSASDEVVSRMRAKAQASAAGALDRALQEAGLTDAAKHCVHARRSAATRVVEAARRTSADLVVLGGANRSDLAYALLGSVGAHVVTDVACDVLLVRAAETDPPPRGAA